MSMNLHALFSMLQEKIELTWYEDVFIRGSNELQCFLAKQSHVLVNCIFSDVFVGTIIESNQDI